VAELLRRKHEVIATDLTHRPDELAFSLQSDVASPRYVRSDVGEFRQIERVIEGLGPFDYVYHCAAEFGRWNGEDFYENLWRTNVIGTKNIIRLQERSNFRLIHFSSSEVYGDWPHLMVETVMSDYALKQLNDYAMTKWVNEMQIANSATQFNTETVVVRLFNTYGPGEYYSPYRSVNCRFVYCALMGIPWTVFRGYSRSSVFLTDAVATVGNIVDNFKPGETYNVGGEQLHTIEELSDIVLDVTGASPELVQYQDMEILTTKQKHVDTSKAKRDLKHEDNYSLRDGVELTTEWMRSAYGLEDGTTTIARSPVTNVALR
jgi:dTDP-glucose 4,6-dehydratase